MVSARRRLIVNADDLGRTAGINAGIFEAHARGLVTSATLMVAFSMSSEAAARLEQYPDLGVGLHVTLTGGRPVLAPELLPSLVDAQGRLPRKPDGLQDAEPAEVLAEVEAQLQRFRQLTGRHPTHLDSHHHSHRLPVVCDAMITVAAREGLPIRNASPDVASRLARAAVPTTATFVEDFFAANATLAGLLAILENIGLGTTEIMCHPAYVDPELRRDSGYTDERERELAVLTHPKAQRAIRERALHLTHFGKL